MNKTKSKIIIAVALIASIKCSNATNVNEIMDTRLLSGSATATSNVHCVLTIMPMTDPSSAITLQQSSSEIMSAEGLIHTQFVLNFADKTASTYSIWTTKENADSFVKSDLHQTLENAFASVGTEQRDKFKFERKDSSYDDAPKSLQAAFSSFFEKK